MSPSTRCALVAAALLGALLAPGGSAAQQGKIPRIGYLIAIPPGRAAGIFEDGLRELGWVKGAKVEIEYHSAEGQLERLPALARELVARRVDVIVAHSAAETQAARQATRSIPIVFVIHGDPVGTGDVASLARPGGNVTGLTQLHPELAVKQVDVLRQLVPRLSRIAVLWNAAVAAKIGDWKHLQAIAPSVAVQFQSREIRHAADLDAAFAAIRMDRPDALLVLGDPVLATLRARVAAFAERERLPAMFPWRIGVESGGLVSYGADTRELIRRGAWYVDRILKGAKPADLPVQQPDRFELAANVKAARALGITFPPSLLLRADYIVE